MRNLGQPPGVQHDEHGGPWGQTRGLGTEDAAEKQPAGVTARRREAGGCSGVTAASALPVGWKYTSLATRVTFSAAGMPEKAGWKHEHSVIQVLRHRAKSPKRRPSSGHGPHAGVIQGLEPSNHIRAHT